MPYINRWRLLASLIVGVQLAACRQQPEVPANIANVKPTKLEYAGPALLRVRLTAKRATELGIQTAPVREENISGKLCKVVAASAVIRDPRGNTSIFKSPDSLVFVRESVSVDHVAGDWAILSDGPPVGTAVVTAGAAELFNNEFEKLREETVESKTAEGGEGKRSSGMATMLENGNIKVVHKAAGVSGLTASVVIEYKPQDEEYQKIMTQVGGLKAGESKSLPPLPEQ